MLCNQLSCCQVGTPSFLHRVKLVPGQSKLLLHQAQHLSLVCKGVVLFSCMQLHLQGFLAS